MAENPKVSVVIPVYNVEKFLPRCLDSVLAQTFDDWEAICVNDGSTDKSGQILCEYAAHDKRIRVIDKENSGVSDARNMGVAAARGEYVLYLDSDDFIHKQTLEITYGLAVKHGADMVSFRYDVDFHRGMLQKIRAGRDISGLMPRSMNVRYNAGRVRRHVTDDILFHATERNHSLGRWRVRHCFPVMNLYRRDLIADIRFIPGIIFEDFPWWSAVMLRRPKTVIIKTPLYFYMPNSASQLCSAKALRMIKSIATGLDAVHKMYGAASEKYRKYYNREFLWPFIIIAARKARELDNPADVDVARHIFENLNSNGVFANPSNRRARRYAHRIKNFIERSR